MISWKAHEENVRTIGSFIWNTDAVNETINGVRFDCVLKPNDDKWIIIECTENETLDKIRTDIAKCAASRHFLFSQDIYPEFYIVLRGDPTEPMRTTATGAKVKLMSFESFSKLFIDYPNYNYSRLSKNFGSSVNPISGEPDKVDYTPVLYENVATKKQVKLNEIAKLLSEGKRIVLLGNYGTGKSRCIKELFNNLSQKTVQKIIYPIAINLKENWGTQRAEEIIRRHMGGLGLSSYSDSVIKIIDSDKFVFLLDGFDEVGAQVWSDDPLKLKQMRSSSLCAVKDLIATTKSPIIITGREHYFNSNEEMFAAIGLNSKDTIVLKCKDEFTSEEMEAYLKSLTLAIELPLWLPKRPLICQIINTLEKEKVETIFNDSFSSVEFWNTLIESICVRESRISPTLNAENIYKILKRISQLTRSKNMNVGPITINEINKSFEFVVGTPPVDETAVMLQRLPALGRVSSESTDRQFVDQYILDGLRADNLIEVVNESRFDVLQEKWLNPLEKTGIEIVAKRIYENKSANVFIEFLKKAVDSSNTVIAGDILSALVCSTTKNSLDLGGIIVQSSHISSINFSNTLAENFMIKDSIIEELDISNCSFSRITIKDCIIRKIYGLTNIEEIPTFLIDCIIEESDFNSLSTYNKYFDLTPSQMIFISIIKKLFFLGGNAKTEKEICKGFGKHEDRLIASSVIKILHTEKVISKVNGDSEGVITPKTFARERMAKILKELSNSKDLLWKEVGNLKIGS